MEAVTPTARRAAATAAHKAGDQQATGASDPWDLQEGGFRVVETVPPARITRPPCSRKSWRTVGGLELYDGGQPGSVARLSLTHCPVPCLTARQQIFCSRPKSGARDPINQSLKPTFNQIEPRSLHPPNHQPGQVRPGSKSGSIIFRSKTEQVSVTADRRADAG